MVIDKLQSPIAFRSLCMFSIIFATSFAAGGEASKDGNLSNEELIKVRAELNRSYKELLKSDKALAERAEEIKTNGLPPSNIANLVSEYRKTGSAEKFSQIVQSVKDKGSWGYFFHNIHFYGTTQELDFLNSCLGSEVVERPAKLAAIRNFSSFQGLKERSALDILFSFEKLTFEQMSNESVDNFDSAIIHTAILEELCRFPDDRAVQFMIDFYHKSDDAEKSHILRIFKNQGGDALNNFKAKLVEQTHS